jgi:hypothetical protein
VVRFHGMYEEKLEIMGRGVMAYDLKQKTGKPGIGETRQAVLAARRAVIQNNLYLMY